MPRKNQRCGVYSITTPNGSVYIGSSYRIEQRWSEHLSALRHRKHHSERLQAAWDKHGEALCFYVICECDRGRLNEFEQHYINKLSPALNTSAFVENVWLNPETRLKFKRVHTSDKWRRQRSEIARKQARVRWVGVDCSDGRSFESITAAAEEFGIRPAGIRHLITTQRTGRLGVRFKRADEEWRPDTCSREVALITRKKNGNLYHSKQTRERLRKMRRGKPLPEEMHKAALAASRKAVVGVCLETGTKILFESQRDAARALRPNIKSASCQISAACAGRKRSAYGYSWGFA